MVGPARKREAVVHVRQSLDVSERRACRATRQPRSTQRYHLKRLDKDKALLEEILRLSSKEKRAGCRTVWRYLRRNGWEVNHKRVHRIWKREGLRVPLKSHKRRRLGGTDQGTQRLRANRRNHVWSYDFVFDQTESGRRLKWLVVLDEYTRECLGLEVEHAMGAREVVGILEKLVAERGAPEFIRSDNGPEFVAREVREWIQSQGFKTLYIELGAPWQNSYTESFNARFRNEFLNVELFSSKLEAKVLSAEHREKYNNQRPHSSLEGMTPGEFAARCLATLQPTAYAPQDSETNPKHQQILS
jgi:transposase InsO family protein